MNNWKLECEEKVNYQINLEYQASYQYDLIASYFKNKNVGLDNIGDYFLKNGNEEREHAHKFIDYQNKRGGMVKFNNIEDVNLDYLNNNIKKKENVNSLDENNILLSFKKALMMEEYIYENLLELHKVGEVHNDPQLCNFIEGEFLEEQITAIYELEKIISQLKLIGDNGHGLWDFNKNL